MRLKDLKTLSSNYNRTRYEQALAHLINSLDLDTLNLTISETWTSLADATDIDVMTNVDLTFYNDFITIMEKYFPRGWKNVMCVNVPVTMTAVVQQVTLAMSQQMRDRIRFLYYCNANTGNCPQNNDLRNYMNEDQIPQNIKSVTTTSLILGDFLGQGLFTLIVIPPLPIIPIIG